MKQIENNIEKYNNYKFQMARLKKAIKYEFFLEAITIEYVILEDRTNSIFKYMNISYIDKDNKPYRISKKLSKIKGFINNKKENIHKFINCNFCDEIQEFINVRNNIIHALINKKIEDSELQNIALFGFDLIKKLNSKTTRFKKELEKEGVSYI